MTTPEKLPKTTDLGAAYTAARIAAAVGGRVVRGEAARRIAGVSTDSRALRPGNLFVAIKGDRFDGHDYVVQAARAGAGAVLVSTVDTEWPLEPDCPVILTRNTQLALRDTAALHRAHLSAAAVAVTGSCGKSTTKSLIAALLRTAGPTTCAEASFNNRIGVSLTILAARPEDRFLVLELGANHPGEIDELASLGRPEVGVITTIGEAHLEGFGTLEGVMEAKGEIIRHIAPGGTLVINGENPWCRKLAARFRGRVVRFGFGRAMDLRAERVRCFPDGTRFTLRGREIMLEAPGKFNVLNALAAIGAAEAIAGAELDAVRALRTAELPPLRANVTRVGDIAFIEDCYNANPTALRSAADLLDAVAPGGRRVAVCGDMKELGRHSERLHRRVGRELARRGVDALIAFGQSARWLAEGYESVAGRGHVCLSFCEEEFTELCHALLGVLEPGSCVLIKGSRAMRMERILETVKAGLRCGSGEERTAA
jgi:UDP-N-acetylmuramoyl-tripeptide--D-alanyl-D-alanine ligase